MNLKEFRSLAVRSLAVRSGKRSYTKPGIHAPDSNITQTGTDLCANQAVRGSLIGAIRVSFTSMKKSKYSNRNCHELQLF